MMEQDKVRKSIRHGSATAWSSIYHGRMKKHKVGRNIQRCFACSADQHKLWSRINRSAASSMNQHERWSIINSIKHGAE
jgi:hypothetical protein